jgi:hypothetical protein
MTHAIRLQAQDRQRGELVAHELESWQSLFGGTTTMLSHWVLCWRPDDAEHATEQALCTLLDSMVEFGVYDPTQEMVSVFPCQ